MKQILGTLIFVMSFNFAMSQNDKFWQRQSIDNTTRVKASKQNLPKTQTFNLNIEGLKQALIGVPRRGESLKPSNVIISFPNSEGIFERFRIVEA